MTKELSTFILGLFIIIFLGFGYINENHTYSEYKHKPDPRFTSIIKTMKEECIEMSGFSKIKCSFIFEGILSK